MAGPIEMPFGMWARVGLSNHVLDGSMDPPRETGMPAVGVLNNMMWRFMELLRSLVVVTILPQYKLNNILFLC